LVTEIDLPDNSGTNPDKYTISYEATPGHTSNTTGRIASITLPTGGSITYTYTGGGNGIMCPSGGTVTMTRKINDDNNNNLTWTYELTANYPPGFSTVVTDPQGNVTDYDLLGIYETERILEQGSSTVLGSVTTCYNGASAPCNGTPVSLPITEIATITNVAGEDAEGDVFYNGYGSVTTVNSYDFGSGSHGSLLSETMTCYSTSFSHILDRPTYQMVYNQTGNSSNCTGTTGLMAEASYTYDSYGNVLAEAHTNTGGSPSSISRSFTYNTNGTVKTATDYNSSSHVTNYTYGSGACNGAFPTTITLPITSLTYELTWSCNGGVLTSVEDPNQQTTTYKYTDPNFWRIKEIDYPDTGKTTISYSDTPFFSISAYSYLNSSTYHETTQILDGLGRVIHTQDNTLGTTVDTAYDGLGRVYSVSNPHTSGGEPTDGTTYYSYDAWGRPSDEGSTHAITYPDSSYTSVTYSAQCPTIIDPAGHARTVCPDGLGRVPNVTEDPSGLKYQTSYTYDALSDLKGVTQGSETRTYNYDMLARLTSAMIPEVNVSGTQCTTTYGYDANGNVTSRTAPLENQNSSCSSTVTTTYSYDAVNRLTSKTYNDSTTPPASYSYDQTSVTVGSWTSPTLLYPKGRMTEATTTSGSNVQTAAVYSYDPVGRTKNFWQCNPSNCGTVYSTSYNYDLAGDITSWTHPGQINLTNTINAAQQITAVQTTSNYTNLPQTLVQNVTYTPWGAVSTFENGCTGSGCTSAQETYQYNKRLQPWVISLAAASGVGSCLVYNYYSSWTAPTSCPSAGSTPPTGSTDNGNVMGYWYNDTVNSSFSHTASYGYDSVNRLTAACTLSGSQCATSGSNVYNLAFAYDQFGNMRCTGGVGGGSAIGPCPAWTYNTGNQLASSTGCTYDAAGNTTKDCSTGHTYQWDAEGRVSSVDSGSTWGFTYDAVGDRAQWAYSGGANQQMFDPNGGWLGIAGALDVLRWGDGAYAWYTGTETYFNHINGIGSTTVLTKHDGTAAEDTLYYPWGQTWQQWGGGGANFAELPYGDGNTNTNLTLYRHQSPGLGRWLSPDLLGGDITNPQSLNLYAYVLNNPTGLIDPLGLDPGQGSDPGECDCGDPNCVNAACWGPGWPPGFWPSNGGEGSGGSGGGGPTVSLPTGNPGGTAGGSIPGVNAFLQEATDELDWPYIIRMIVWGWPIVKAAVAAVGSVPAALPATLVGAVFMPSDVAPHVHQARKPDLRQFDEAVRRIEARCGGKKLTPDQRRRLHDAISKWGYGLDIIVEIGVGMFCPGGPTSGEGGQ